MGKCFFFLTMNQNLKERGGGGGGWRWCRVSEFFDKLAL